MTPPKRPLAALSVSDLQDDSVMSETVAGWSVDRRGAVQSTMTIARDLAQSEASDRTVVVADEQTVGRGRQGRVWSSPPGNLYMTAILRPDVPLARAGEASMVAGVALADALSQILSANRTVRLKWPNDVLVDDGKVSGILAETFVEDGTLTAILVGIGLNVASKPDLPDRPTSRLFEMEGRLDAVLETVLTALDKWITVWSRVDGFSAIRLEWMRYGPEEGRCVRQTAGWTGSGTFSWGCGRRSARHDGQ